MSPSDGEPRSTTDDGDFVEAKTVLALVAAWLLPGAGHFVLGRARRGLLFGALIIGSFGFGLAHDGRLALRDNRQPFLTGLQVVANLGVGPLDPVARLFVYGELAYRLPPAGRERSEDLQARIFRERTRSPLSIYGTAFVWTAGLMNLLLLFDIWDISRGRK